MTEKVLMLNGLKEVVMSHLAKLLIFEKELKKKLQSLVGKICL